MRVRIIAVIQNIMRSGGAIKWRRAVKVSSTPRAFHAGVHSHSYLDIRQLSRVRRERLGEPVSIGLMGSIDRQLGACP
jgi:hypothetical protein